MLLLLLLRLIRHSVNCQLALLCVWQSAVRPCQQFCSDDGSLWVQSPCRRASEHDRRVSRGNAARCAGALQSYTTNTRQWTISHRTDECKTGSNDDSDDDMTWAARKCIIMRDFLPTSYFYRATVKHTHGPAVDICLSVRSSICLSNAWIMTKRDNRL